MARDPRRREGGGAGGELRAARTMAVTSAARVARSRRWPGVLVWALWALALLGIPAVAWSDHLLRQAGRPDLVQLTPGAVPAVLAVLSAATVGAVLASRRPRHPVGWLLLALALSLVATAVAAQYLVYGLLVRPGALPAARYAALYYPATVFTALALIGFVLLLTPTGSLPSPRWRWWARGMVAAPVVLLLVVTLAPGPLDPRYQAVGGPFDFRGLGGVVLLGGGYAGVVLGLGQLLGQDSPLVVAAATLAVAAAFQPARRRVQRAVERRFNRRRYDAVRTIQAFSARLRQQVDLDTLTAELLAVVEQTMQPTRVSLWLRPPHAGPGAAGAHPAPEHTY